MKAAFLTESRADWGGIYPIVKEFAQNSHECEVWITGEHLERGTISEIYNSALDGYPWEIKIFPNKYAPVGKLPDILFVLGDREMVLYKVIEAWKAGIKIAHIAGGDKQEGRLIDEPIRYCISEFADIHFPSTEKSANRLRSRYWVTSIHNVGSPYIEKLREAQNLADSNVPVFQRYNNSDSDYYIVQMHPCGKETDLELAELAIVLDALKGKNVKLMRPNWDCQTFLLDFTYFSTEYNVETIENVPRERFLSMLFCAKCFIGNSSALFLEAQYLGTPCLHVGKRNLGREEAFPGHMVHWDTEMHETIAWYIAKAIHNDAREKDGLRKNWRNGAHGDGLSAKKIREIIENVYSTNL